MGMGAGIWFEIHFYGQRIANNFQDICAVSTKVELLRALRSPPPLLRLSLVSSPPVSKHGEPAAGMGGVCF